MTFTATIPLTRAGTFKLRIMILDRVANNSAKFELPLVVE